MNKGFHTQNKKYLTKRTNNNFQNILYITGFMFDEREKLILIFFYSVTVLPEKQDFIQKISLKKNFIQDFTSRINFFNNFVLLIIL